MPTSASPTIDHLDQTWRSLVELCETLTEEEWKRPTGCPGWTVQDNVAHLIDYEARALGRPAPAGDPITGPHTRNDLGVSNEVGVAHRRPWSGTEVLAELREVTAARSAQLHGLAPDDLDRQVTTPAGPRTLADSLVLRLMDTWTHEQDVRRALGRPGHDRGPAVEASVAYFTQFLPVVVGKRAAAPEGAVVVLDVGDVHRAAVEVTDGRARPVDAAEAAGRATVRLAMPTTTYVAVVGGRSDAPDDVAIEGDVALGRRIVGALAFMP